MAARKKSGEKDAPVQQGMQEGCSNRAAKRSVPVARRGKGVKPGRVRRISEGDATHPRRGPLMIHRRAFLGSLAPWLAVPPSWKPADNTAPGQYLADLVCEGVEQRRRDMATDKATGPGDEKTCVRLCPFPEGNRTAFPYPLSIHGAGMLARGIEAYARQAVAMHESGEPASYCLLMTHTAIEEAGKLREWAVRATPDYLVGTIRALDELLRELAAQGDRFEALNLDDLFGGGETAGEQP